MLRSTITFPQKLLNLSSTKTTHFNVLMFAYIYICAHTHTTHHFLPVTLMKIAGSVMESRVCTRSSISCPHSCTSLFSCCTATTSVEHCATAITAGITSGSSCSSRETAILTARTSVTLLGQ